MVHRTRRVSQSLPHRRPDDPAASPCVPDPALGVPDVDHRARTTGIGTGGGHNIPLSIEAHTVNPPLRSPVILAELMQDSVVAQGAIRLNIVASQLPPLRVGLDHVEGALVSRDQEAI